MVLNFPLRGMVFNTATILPAGAAGSASSTSPRPDVGCPTPNLVNNSAGVGLGWRGQTFGIHSLFT